MWNDRGGVTVGLAVGKRRFLVGFVLVCVRVRLSDERESERDMGGEWWSE